MVRASFEVVATPPVSAKSRLVAALESGEKLTRPEACERFGITGATFRWTIQKLQAEGMKLAYKTERGQRNAIVRRWHLVKKKRLVVTAEATRRYDRHPPNVED